MQLPALCLHQAGGGCICPSPVSNTPPNPPPAFFCSADAAEVKPLKLMATQWHIAFGLMLIMGLLLQKIM